MAESESALVGPFPCPDCVGVLLPGETVTFPRSRGAGKVAWNPSWNWPSGSFQPGVELPPNEYIKCRRCDGTGLVKDRRVGPTNRRKALAAPA